MTPAGSIPAAGARGCGPPPERRALVAPAGHGATCIDPPLAFVPELVEANRARRRRYDYDVQGRSLAVLAAAAREEMLGEAHRYTSAYRDVEPPAADAEVFLAGHQPQLFHPGVWFKHFALARLAGERRAAAVNLIIDSDTIKDAALRVPGGTVDQPLLGTMPYDQATAEIPYEHRVVQDRELFAGFGRGAAAHLAPLVPDPLLVQFWPLVALRLRETGNLGECLSQARHQLEGQWGLATLEIPQSRICQLGAFYWFLAHLLAELPRLWEIYNDSVGEYRLVHGVRSANHPVPDLAAEGDWLEAPFWIWTDAAPRRRRLFARQRGRELVLSDRGAVDITLPLSSGADAARAVDVLAGLPGRGIRLRTRALGTTLFARLLLGDLFLHGIGGAKYDQLTDLLIGRFFGLEPPGYLVLSATLHLPLQRERATADDARRVNRLLRELEYHPELYVALHAAAGAEAVAAIENKRRWVQTAPTRANARARCQQIRGANAALRPWVEPLRRELLAESEQVARLLRAEAVLARRDYSFCLYPEKTLRDFLLAFPAARP